MKPAKNLLTSPANDTSPTSPVDVHSRSHNASHQIRLLRAALQSEKGQIGFLLGAGCPLGIKNEEGDNSEPLVPDVIGLTKHVAESLTTDKLPLWERLVEACRRDSQHTPNVEDVLTQIRQVCAIHGGIQYLEVDQAALRDLDVRICSLISSAVDKPLPNHITSYDIFASWIGHVVREYPIELFTPNYDLLMEEALERRRIPYFDGFVGAREPFFDIAAIEHDPLPPRWCLLWKIHGSINWVQKSSGHIVRSRYNPDDDPMLIYPSHLKYDQSRRMPYLAMLDRLRSFLNIPHVLFIICGYSFSDVHINEVLMDGLRNNPSAHCAALMHKSISGYPLATNIAMKTPNLSLLARTDAIIGTKFAAYTSNDSAPDSSCQGGDTQFVLGDFYELGLFLQSQFGLDNREE